MTKLQPQYSFKAYTLKIQERAKAPFKLWDKTNLQIKNIMARKMIQIQPK